MQEDSYVSVQPSTCWVDISYRFQKDIHRVYYLALYAIAKSWRDDAS